MDGNKFSFPLKLTPESLEAHLKNRQCLVVSFFGKTPYTLRSNKGAFIDQVVGRSIFGTSNFITEDDPIEPLIEGYFCPEKDCVFLHMRGWMDTYSLAEKCRQADEYLQHKGILAFWSSRRYEHARAALALFHLSHIMVCCSPGHTFDISYVHLFKSLDNLRNKIQPAVADVLKSVPGIPKDWINHGRPCSPRVLFLFLSCPTALRGTRGSRDERRDAKPHKHPPIKRLEYSLEDQIYRILRKARIITNVAANSLFAVPSNQEFVYVETGSQGTTMDTQATLVNNCFSLMGAQDISDIVSDSGPFYTQFLTEESREKRCFSNFLREHINIGFERGFSDNISKHIGHSGGNQWEVPTLGVWVEVADKLFDLFTEELTSEEGQKHSEAMMTLRDDMETEIMFSELRCKKILPTAISAYTDGLPPHYTAEYHNAKLLGAMSMYSMQARGPASEKFAEVLAAECTNYWQSGRQMCEEISLTGNHCTARRHTLPGQDNMLEVGNTKKILPTMQHISGVQYIAACNCGRRQANREDPFKLVDANYNFYQQLEEDCCKDLEHVSFPEYSPAKVNLVPTEKIVVEVVEQKEEEEEEEEKQTEKEDEVVVKENSDVVPEVKIEEPSDNDENKEEKDPSPERVETPAEDEAEIIMEVLENLHIEGSAGKSPSKVASLLARASSQVEFLPHMKTLSSAPGLKPEFPSWSLVMVGSSHLYSHSSGLGAQPGFMSSSKFLLPWEVPLTKLSTAELNEKWPNIMENAAKRASLRGPDEPVDNRITVKVFIGFEYECPRGHRFMVSAPEKPMKSSSTMREAANKLVACDLPLYMACPCRITKPPVAQLTRLHVVTPKAPVWVTINPQIQPSPGGPIFVTGWDAPHRLSINSYWVLRLPYVYSGEGGAHLPPVTPPSADSPCGCLLKGSVCFDEDFSEG